MDPIQAIYVNGVFQPTGPVSLPENTPVDVFPTARADEPKEKSPPTELYRLLDQRFSTGRHDLAARHNEHQP